jgi:hypothetical protein
MLICVKITKKRRKVFYQTDRQTQVQLKTIVRNLTKKNIQTKKKYKKKQTFLRTDIRTTQNYSSEPHKIN